MDVYVLRTTYQERCVRVYYNHVCIIYVYYAGIYIYIHIHHYVHSITM